MAFGFAMFSFDYAAFRHFQGDMSERITAKAAATRLHPAVIGNGIVGTACAAWLQRDGHSITFVDPRHLAMPLPVTVGLPSGWYA
jgi:hypothetical protein